MKIVYLLSVWIHVVAVIIWVGGMCFVAFALIPTLRKPEMRPISPRLIHLLGIHFRKIGWICLGLLILTGFTNLFLRGLSWTDIFSVPILRAKLFFVGIILLLSVFHDFVIGPRATAILQADPTSSEAQKWRRRASWMGRITLLLALIAVTLGILFSRGGF